MDYVVRLEDDELKVRLFLILFFGLIFPRFYASCGWGYVWNSLAIMGRYRFVNPAIICNTFSISSNLRNGYFPSKMLNILSLWMARWTCKRAAAPPKFVNAESLSNWSFFKMTPSPFFYISTFWKIHKKRMGHSV